MSENEVQQNIAVQDMTNEQRKQLAESGGASSAGGSMLFNRAAFAQAYQVARLFSESQLIPAHMQGKANDCFIAMHMAHRLGEDPLMVMQNIVIVHGTAGWKAQWLIGRANRSGVFRGRIRFETTGTGDDLKVTARATLADTGEEVEAEASMKMAQLEGWTKNAKYKSMPQQMLSYRAASFLIRLYCPEATLGYQSAEEVEDLAAAGRLQDVTPGRHTPTAADAVRKLEPAAGKAEQPQDPPATGNDEPADELPELDADGLPWDERIHSNPAKINASDGRWRRRRGVQDDEYKRIADEIRASQGETVENPSDPGVPSEPEGAAQSDDPEGVGEGAAQGVDDDAGAAAGDDAFDDDVPPPDQLQPSARAGEAKGDREIMQLIYKKIPQAIEEGDRELLDDLDDEAREIQSDESRSTVKNHIAQARTRIQE